jgi:hypothetical protein
MIAVSMLASTSAQTRVPGVSVGDSFKYSFDFSINVSNSSFTLPSLVEGLLAEVENIDSVQATVTQISGSTVTMQTAMQFKNGTEQTATSTFNVANGQDTTEESAIGMFLISANLNAGDQIYESGSRGTINETITKAYPSGSRQVNHQNIIMNYDVSQEELEGTGITNALQQTNTQNTYWDKQTGALVEMSYSMTTRSEQINADIALNVELIESSTFTVPEFPAAFLFVVLALAVSAFAVTVRYTGKHKAHN